MALSRSDRGTRRRVSHAGPAGIEPSARLNRFSGRLRSSLYRLADLVVRIVGFCARLALPALLIGGSIALLGRVQDADNLGQRPLREPKGDVCHHPVYGFDLAPEAGTALVRGRDSSVASFDIEHGSVLDRFNVAEADRQPRCLARAPDADAFLTGCDDGTIQLWMRRDGEFHHRQLGRHPGVPRTCAWSGDGSRAASGCDEGLVLLWDFRRDGAVAELRFDDVAITGLDFLPDGRLVVADWAGRIHLWDGRAGSRPHRLVDDVDPVTCLTVARDGSFVVSGSMYGAVRCRELPTGRQRWEVKPVQSFTKTSVAALACSASAGIVASTRMFGGPRCSITLRDAATGEVVRTLEGHSDNVRRLAFASSGSRLYSAGYDGSFRVWDTENGRCLRVFRRILTPR